MASSLAQQLKQRREGSRAKTAAEDLAVMDQATAEVAASGIANSSVGVGAKVPDFSLPNADGTELSLSSLLAKGPVVLTFYRGGWCPYCSIELRALQNTLAAITAAGATLTAVSPQTPDNSLSTAQRLELVFPVLSDEGNHVAESFGLVFTLPEALRQVYSGKGIDLPAANGDTTFRLPIPATYVIRTDGTVAWRFADPDYTKRAEPDDLLAALATL
jgi:peroxiredoxin